VGLKGRPLDGLGLRPSIGLDGVMAWRLVLAYLLYFDKQAGSKLRLASLESSLPATV
jgi:hypothetical protein